MIISVTFASMTRVVAYVLLAVLLSGNVPVSQLCKIPILLQHYHEHQQRNSQIGFIDFLEMHYWGNDMDDDDDDRDMQLPFKKDTIVYAAYYYVPPYKIQIIKPAAVPVIAHCEVNESLHLDAHPGSLFRPPRTTA